MRHHHSGRQLSRIAPHRHALLRNMAAALLRHETIRTTLPKAKELRRMVEPLITLAKQDSEAARRRAFAKLRDKELVEKLFTDIGPHYANRPGGYTRILHMVPRAGDAAPMALMQLVDRAEKSAQADEPQKEAARPARSRKARKAAPADGSEEEKPVKSEKKKAPKKAAAAAKAPAGTTKKPAKKTAKAKKKS